MVSYDLPVIAVGIKDPHALPDEPLGKSNTTQAITSAPLPYKSKNRKKKKQDLVTPSSNRPQPEPETSDSEKPESPKSILTASTSNTSSEEKPRNKPTNLVENGKTVLEQNISVSKNTDHSIPVTPQTPGKQPKQRENQLSLPELGPKIELATVPSRDNQRHRSKTVKRSSSLTEETLKRKPLPTSTQELQNHQRQRSNAVRKSKSLTAHLLRTHNLDPEQPKRQRRRTGPVDRSKSLTTEVLKTSHLVDKRTSTPEELNPQRSKSSKSHRPQRRSSRSTEASTVTYLELIAKDNFALQSQEPQKPGSEKSVSTSRSRSIRVDFDGTVKSTPSKSSRPHRNNSFPQQKLKLSKSVGIDRSSSSTKPSSSYSNKSTSSSSCQSSNLSESKKDISKDRIYHRRNTKIHPKSKMSTPMGPNDENIELFSNDAEKQVEMSPDDRKENSSGCKLWLWLSIICGLIVIAAIVVPCVLFLGGSSGGNSNFPQVKKAGGSTVVASIPKDICHEGIPNSGSCTPENSDEEQQGSELCNLLAKSMINTTIYGDIALINAGICKQGFTAPDITAGDIKSAIDLKKLVAVEISGVDLSALLEEAATVSFGEGGNPDAYPYAAGLRYNFEANLPASKRVSNIQVNRGVGSESWEPIDVRKFYTVITTESLSKGEMGYTTLGNAVSDWKDPLNINAGDAFYNYAMKNAENPDWSVLPSSEYSTQYFIGENEEPTFAFVPARLCHALVPGQPVTDSCTAADVVNGGQVCNLAALAIYDQNFGVDVAMLKASTCKGNIDEGKLGESAIIGALSEDQSLVTSDLLGSQIVGMLENGVSAAVDSGSAGEYPYASGLKFDVNTSASPKVSNVEIISTGGIWVPIVATKTYTVATTENMAGSSASKPLGTTLKKEIIGYAEDWETIYTPSADKVSTRSFV